MSLFNTYDTVLADLKRIHRLARGGRTYDTYQINFEVPSNSSNEKIVKSATPIILKDLGRTYEIEGTLEVYDAKTSISKIVNFNWRPQKLKIEIPEEYKMKNQPQRESPSKKSTVSKGLSAVGKWLDSLPDDMSGDLFSTETTSRKRSSSSSSRKTTSNKSGTRKTSTGVKRKTTTRRCRGWS